MKRTMQVTLVLGATLLLSCSKDSSEGKSGPRELNNSESLETEMFGSYTGVLAPINKKVSRHLNGTVSLIRDKEEITIDVKVNAGPRAAVINQSIHIGSRCPSEQDDLNNDGFVDANEGAKVYDKVIIPLDDDIGSQHIGLGIYPVSDNFGYYLWSRTTSFVKLQDDLQDEDINLKDDYVKLLPDKNLTIIGKVAVIRGVPESTILPDSVSGRGKLSPHQGLPVACGVLQRVGPPPGEVDLDETGIPVPEGETVGGGYSGVDDGALFTPTPDGSDYGSEDEVVTVSNETEHG